MSAIIIGCDPGKTGALAAIDQDGNLHDTWDMPVVGKVVAAPLLADIFVPLQRVAEVCVIEDVHSSPQMGVTSAFSFGRALGALEGVALGANIPVRFVSPRRWKRALGLSPDKEPPHPTPPSAPPAPPTAMPRSTSATYPR